MMHKGKGNMDLYSA